MRTHHALLTLFSLTLASATASASEPLRAQVEDWVGAANSLSGACGRIAWGRVDVLGATEVNGAVTLNLSSGFLALGDRAVRDQAARCLVSSLSSVNGLSSVRIRIAGRALELAPQSAATTATVAPTQGEPASYRVVVNPAGGTLPDASSAVAGMDGAMNAETAMSLANVIASAGVEVVPTRQADKHNANWQLSALGYLGTLGVDDSVLPTRGSLAEQDLASRALYANSLNAQLLLTLDAGGAERVLRVYYSPEGPNAAASLQRARSIHDALLRELTARSGNTWADGGVIACAACSTENRLAAMPAVFVETGGGTTPASVSPRYRIAAGTAVKTALSSGSSIMAAPAGISAPASGSTLAGASQTFTWNAVTGATDYYLFVGNWVGGNTLFSREMGLLTSFTVTGLPTDGRTLYVRLWSYIDGGWVSSDAQYTAATTGGSAPAPSTLSSPTDGSTFGSTTVTFTWTKGSAVVDNYLFVGKWKGDNSIFAADVTGKTTIDVSGLPSDGTGVSVRLWSYINGVWQYNDYTFNSSASSGPPEAANMQLPVLNSVLPGSSVTFSWSKGTAVSRYWLQVGYWTGGDTLYSKDEVTALTDTVSGIPTDGRDIYVRLWSYINGAWTNSDSIYHASTASGTPTKAMITSPASGSTLSSGTTTFTWNTGIGVAEYYLFVGTAAGANDIYSKAEGTGTSDTVTLPANKTVFVRLWSYINGAYSAADFAYQTGN